MSIREPAELPDDLGRQLRACMRCGLLKTNAQVSNTCISAISPNCIRSILR